jgi:putative addiction module killer protein
MMKKELRTYRTKEGKEPFIEWLESLKDTIGKAHITNRLDRATFGNYGDCEPVGHGVKELRIHYGPGYRVYFFEQEYTVLLLLIGGSKRTQNKDIKKAQQYLTEFQERYYD